MGRLLGESQSISPSDSGLFTATVSLGLRPVDSVGVQVARAPQADTTASLLSTAAWIIVDREMLR